MPQSLRVTRLGFRSYPTGLSIPEAITTTISFFRSNKPVYTTGQTSLRPISLCQPTQAMARPVLSYLSNAHPTFPGRVNDFHGCLYPGLGNQDGGFPDSGFWTHSDRKLHINTLELKANFGKPPLGFGFMGPPTYDRYRQHYSCGLYQQTGSDPFPCPVRVGPIPMPCYV